MRITAACRYDNNFNFKKVRIVLIESKFLILYDWFSIIVVALKSAH